MGLSLVRVRFGSHLGPLWLWQSLLANGRALYFAIYCGQAVQPLVLLTSLLGDEYSGSLESRPDSTSTLISGEARLPGPSFPLLQREWLAQMAFNVLARPGNLFPLRDWLEPAHFCLPGALPWKGMRTQKPGITAVSIGPT